MRRSRHWDNIAAAIPGTDYLNDPAAFATAAQGALAVTAAQITADGSGNTLLASPVANVPFYIAGNDGSSYLRLNTASGTDANLVTTGPLYLSGAVIQVTGVLTDAATQTPYLLATGDGTGLSGVLHDATAFATAAQGTTADTALQPVTSADGTYPIANDGATSGQLTGITITNGLITGVW